MVHHIRLIQRHMPLLVCGGGQGKLCPFRQNFTSQHRVYHAGVLSAPRASTSFSSMDESDDMLTKASSSGHFSDTPLASNTRLLTDSFVSLNILFFVLQIAFPNELHLTDLGVNVHAFVDQGEIWRLFTAMFLHGSFMHLLLNNLSLHSLGSITEWTCGKKRFLLIYLLSGIGGNVASYLATSGTSEEQIASLGASGAIFGLAGALIVYFARNQVLYRDKTIPSGMLLRLLLTVTGNFAIGSLLPNIDEAGHWGGLLTGMVLALVLGPHYELCKLKGHAENEVYLVDSSIMREGEEPRLVFLIPPRN